MNTSKMIRTLDQLCDRMASSKVDFTMHKMRAIEGGYKWWCWFDYENKYGGTVEYKCNDVSLDKALANTGALNGKMTLSIQEYSGDPSTRVEYRYGYVAVMRLGIYNGEDLRLVGEGKYIYDALKALAKEIKGRGLDEFKI